MKNYHDILFPYSYNILGSSEDAKDTIQDVLIKYLSIEKKHIENEIGYLIKSTINQSINVKNKKKTVSMDNVWLPEPVSTENPDSSIELAEILSYSMLVLLEKLSAKERAVFILKEAYSYSHKEIVNIIGGTIENSRKLLSRAKNKVGGSETMVALPRDTSKLEFYLDAMQNADMPALEELLNRDIILAADGGESVKVVRELTTGIRKTSKLLLYVYKAFLTGLDVRITQINHQPAILFFRNDILQNCQVFETENAKIKTIYSIVDPNKLKSIFH
ncbi:sigma factor-like helix-turn-helix DNA-binding protein [Thalassobellus sediminis]|uniref:sigma factor-like helix-turn-helix DNA-binding protein n=1 Tax=Thalassobellus sediminis TaxID=3367753 RepID=UPI00378787C0